jgi:hypothetical protein
METLKVPIPTYNNEIELYWTIYLEYKAEDVMRISDPKSYYALLALVNVLSTRA